MQHNHLNPWRLISGLDRDIGRLFDREAATRPGFSPAIDIDEEPDRFVVRADLPGVEAEKVDISVDQGFMTIAGRRDAPAGNEASPRHAERACGAFERIIRLPETAADEGMAAEYRHGVLIITIPKTQKARPYRIEVGAN